MTTVQIAGFSYSAGILKFRTANDMARAEQLAKLGDVNIHMALLPSAMTKNDAAKYVLTNLAVSYPQVDQAEAAKVLTGLIKDENPFARPAKKTVAKKPKTVAVKNIVVKKTQVEPGQFDWDAPMSPKEAAKIRAEFMKKLKAAYEAN
jgi:hypothetical protein